MILTLEQAKERLKEISEEPMFIHLYSDCGDHIWYKNVPIGRIMLETDMKTILELHPKAKFVIESRDTR